MAKINTIDISSLEHIQTELINVGFEPVDEDLREWEGPILGSFSSLTDVERMKVVFQDGWPFLHPKIFVEGIESEHVNARNEVCLWRDDDGSMDWVTLDGIEKKIDEWCALAKEGFREEDVVLDAHLYYENITPKLALLDISEIVGEKLSDGDIGYMYAHKTNEGCIKINKVRNRSKGRVVWYFRSHIDLPPANISSLRVVLHSKQQKDLERRINAIKKRHADAIDYIILIWQHKSNFNVQIIKVEVDRNSNISSIALTVAPVDKRFLTLRSGHQLGALSKMRFILFGVGAIGSHVSLQLAKMGTETLKIVDRSIIRPSHIVRHIADHQHIGLSKVIVVKRIIEQSVQSIQVETIEDICWDPEKLKELCEGVDLIIETTGFNSFSQNISFVAESIQKPLVSSSLYRSGNIARVRYQSVDDEYPVYKRLSVTKYPIIPYSHSDAAGLEPGCSSPVINSPPQSVYGISALTCQVISDICMGKETSGFDLIQVYSGIGEPPFDKIGILKF